MNSPFQTSTGVATIAGSIALARGLVIADPIWLVLIGTALAAVIAAGLFMATRVIYRSAR